MSTIRDDYPTKINNTALFRPEKWSINRGKVKKAFQTEAGTDSLLVTRTGKVTISAEYSCTAAWLAIFQGWDDSASLTVKYYDPLVPGYAEKTMYMDEFKFDMVPASDYLKDSQSLGLYTVSFDLIEF